jgi:diazepam-binding inhibitor (GABA receptor modulating acyl-CoA-binding protein)
MSSETEFQDAVARAKTLPKQPNEVLLELYGLYKQATEGDVGIDPPGMFDFVGRAKYDAWLSRKGMTQGEATTSYIALVNRLAQT